MAAAPRSGPPGSAARRTLRHWRGRRRRKKEEEEGAKMEGGYKTRLHARAVTGREEAGPALGSESVRPGRDGGGGEGGCEERGGSRSLSAPSQPARG